MDQDEEPQMQVVLHEVQFPVLNKHNLQGNNCIVQYTAWLKCLKDVSHWLKVLWCMVSANILARVLCNLPSETPMLSRDHAMVKLKCMLSTNVAQFQILDLVSYLGWVVVGLFWDSWVFFHPQKTRLLNSNWKQRTKSPSRVVLVHVFFSSFAYIISDQDLWLLETIHV